MISNEWAIVDGGEGGQSIVGQLSRGHINFHMLVREGGGKRLGSFLSADAQPIIVSTLTIDPQT